LFAYFARRSGQFLVVALRTKWGKTSCLAIEGMSVPPICVATSVHLLWSLSLMSDDREFVHMGLSAFACASFPIAQAH
jgi:hypothetical protein